MVVTDRFNPIVFDLGSSSARVGWAGTDQPKYVESSLMGRKLSDGTIDPSPLRFGNKKYTEPIDPVRCVSYYDGEWSIDPEILAPITDTLCFSSRGLNANAFERPIITTCPSTSPSSYKKILFEHFMETVQAPAFFVGDTSVLSIYATGRVSGICVDIGACATSMSVVDKGQVVQSYTYAVGGDFIDQFVLSRLGESISVPMSDMTDNFLLEMKLSTIREIKHAACKCSHHSLPTSQVSPAGRSARNQRKSASGNGSIHSPQGSITGHHAETFRLPDGTDLDVSSVSEQAAEQLFRNHDGGYPGLSEALKAVLSEASDIDDPFVVLTGGSSQFHGLHTRLVHETESMERPPLIFPFSQWTHRSYSGYVGASILASLSSFASLWVTPSSYSEQGVDRLINTQ